MAGIQRSQGCRACRQGRRGCDLQKPTCGRCARLEIVCYWDERVYTFVPQDRDGRSSVLSTPSVSVSINSPSTRSVTEIPLTRSAALGEGDHTRFWTLYLPRDNADIVGETHVAPWASTIQDLASSNDTVRTALSACAMTVLGQAQGDPNLCQEAIRLYSSALFETNQNLQDQVQTRSDAVLAACVLLAEFEILRRDAEDGILEKGRAWQQHVQGICKIVQLRGRSASNGNAGHTLFKEFRVTAALLAMFLRKPSFLGDASWLTSSWERESYDLRDELCDIMISIPELLKAQDTLISQFASSHRIEAVTMAEQHVKRCIGIGQDLQAWERRMIAASAGETGILTASTAGAPSLLEMCRVHSYEDFHTIMLYWASCLILYCSAWAVFQRMRSTIQNASQPGFTTTIPFSEPPDWMDAQSIAAKLIECLPHYSVTEAGFWGAVHSIFPVGIAIHYDAALANSDSQEVVGLCQMLQSKPLGVLPMSFLRSIAYYNDPHERDPFHRQQHREMARYWFGM